MAPLKSHYDYLVIGGGSGGVASARRAASLGAKTLVIEGSRLGGTCVNVGCVPKKVMWAASDMATKLHQADAYGFKGVAPKNFDWPGFTAIRNAYVERLNGIYGRNMEKEGVEYVFGWAKFQKKAAQSPVTSAKDIAVEVDLREGGTKTFTADNILIATGGTAIIPEGIEGAELGMTSDGFFELSEQPQSVAVVGAGYIGVEFAGVLHGLGTETHLIIRGDTVLRSFDPIIQNTITDTYVKHGVHLHKKSNVKRVEKAGQQLRISLDTGNTLLVDKLIWTIGRKPLHESLNLGSIGVKWDEKGHVVVDEYQNTTLKNVYSVGDVTGHVELTPVAIAAGRKLSMRLFGGTEHKQAKLDYENVPSVVFSHPEAGSIGLTETQAREKFGAENIKVYQSIFTSMYYAPMKQEDKESTAYKIIVNTADRERVVGLHIVGDSSAEILQGFGVAIKMGATKADFDNVVAIHPTAAEELVTMR